MKPFLVGFHIKWNVTAVRRTHIECSLFCHNRSEKPHISQWFLAAQSSSWSLVVGPSVTFVKKWPLECQMVTKTFLPSNICDSNHSSDSSDCSENLFFHKIKTFFSPKKLFINQKKEFHQKKTFFHQKAQIVMKITRSSPEKFFTTSSNCEENQKLKLWWISTTQIVMKLNDKWL